MTQDPQRPFQLPADAVEIVLVRHGAAVDDGPVKFVDGQADHPLTPHGIEQAERIADRLARHATAALFVSNMRRTAQTAAPLAARMAVEPVVLPGLREVHVGAWEADHRFARRVAARDPAIRELLRSGRWETIPGAESSAALARRVAETLERIADAVPPGSTAVAFSHAGVIAEACRQATGSTPFAFLRAENGSLTRIVVDRRGRLGLRSFNDTSHLI